MGRGSTPPGGQREGLPGKVTWNLGHHTLPSPGRGWRQRQTRPPTSVPGPCPLPYFLSLAICSQDAIAKGIFAPSTLLALQGPLRLRGNHTVPQTGKLLSSLSLCTHPPPPHSLPTFPPEAATPGSEGSGGQGRVSVTHSCPQHLPGTGRRSGRAQAIQTSLISLDEGGARRFAEGVALG